MEKDLFGICPFVTAQRILQGKWAVLILHHLEGGPVRFNELQRLMPKMTHATLSVQLKQLEQHGLVKREEFPQIPPKVEYSLTEVGRSFHPVLEQIDRWGQLYIRHMEGKAAS